MENEYLPAANEASTAFAPQQQWFNVDVYRHIVLDQRISAGAFRLWHYFKTIANKELRCWPTFDQICNDLGCKRNSIKGWVRELSAGGGYLDYWKNGQRGNNVYQILCGDGRVRLPEWASRAEQKRLAKAKPVPKGVLHQYPKGSGAVPKRVPVGSTQKGTVSNAVTGEVSLTSEALPEFEPVKHGLWPSEYDGLAGQVKQRMSEVFRDLRYVAPVPDSLSKAGHLRIQEIESQMRGADDMAEPEKSELLNKYREDIAQVRSEARYWRTEPNETGHALLERLRRRLDEINAAASGQKLLQIHPDVAPAAINAMPLPAGVEV